MNQAIKINPNFSTAFVDRGISNYDKNDFDRIIAATDPLSKPKPAYAVSFSGHGSAYENRREGDRIIQEANQAIRNNLYNAYAYSDDTFPPVPQPVAPIAAPAPSPMPEPVIEQAPAAEADPVNVPMPQPNPRRQAKIRQSQRY
jgi:hypothetical protein